MFNCERRQGTKYEKKRLDHIPLGEIESQEWIKSRKVDKHLDLDFLPRSLVYNNDDLATSNKQMEAMLNSLMKLQAPDNHISFERSKIKE